MERTLVLIKPDAVRSHHVGDIIAFYERNGLFLADLRWIQPTKDLLCLHYEEHLARDFYPSLEAFMLSGPVVAIALEGEDAVEAVRELHGSTNPAKARYGTIRHMYGTDVQRNAVHGSADRQAALRELTIWFQ